MKNDIQFIVSDLDGTLLNDEKNISPFTEQTLLEYQKQGKTVVLASGRYEREIKRYAKQLQLDQYGGYIVCGNGYEIINCQTNETHHFETINPTIAKKCVELAQKHHLLQYIRIDGKYHLSTTNIQTSLIKGLNETLRFMLNHGLKKGSYVTHLLDETTFANDLTQYIHQGIVKIAVIGTPKNQRLWIESLEACFPHTFAYYPVNPYSIEITMKSVSKRHATEWIANQKGLSLDHVIAFGDSGNDEPLLLNAKIGITMKNGTKSAIRKAKQMANYTNNEDGVARTCLDLDI